MNRQTWLVSFVHQNLPNPAETGPYGARAGLRAGDVIAEINGARVSDTGEALRKLEASGRWLGLLIVRGGKPLQLEFRL